MVFVSLRPGKNKKNAAAGKAVSRFEPRSQMTEALPDHPIDGSCSLSAAFVADRSTLHLEAWQDQARLQLVETGRAGTCARPRTLTRWRRGAFFLERDRSNWKITKSFTP